VVNKVTFESEETFPSILEEGETYFIDVQREEAVENAY